MFFRSLPACLESVADMSAAFLSSIAYSVSRCWQALGSCAIYVTVGVKRALLVRSISVSGRAPDKLC